MTTKYQDPIDDDHEEALLVNVSPFRVGDVVNLCAELDAMRERLCAAETECERLRKESERINEIADRLAAAGLSDATKGKL